MSCSFFRQYTMYHCCIAYMSPQLFGGHAIIFAAMPPRMCFGFSLCCVSVQLVELHSYFFLRCNSMCNHALTQYKHLLKVDCCEPQSVCLACPGPTVSKRSSICSENDYTTCSEECPVWPIQGNKDAKVW